MTVSKTAWLLVALAALGGLFFALVPGTAADKLSAIAYGLDPQRPSHTYILGGAPLPLEARKTGMFGGFLLAYVALLVAGRGRSAGFPPRRLSGLLLGFIALMAFDGLNATFFDLGWPHLYAPDLRLRLATGLLTGVAMAGLLLPAANGVLWGDIDTTPSLAGGAHLAAILFVAAVFFVLVDARLGILYYPVGIFSVAGLVSEIVLINLILVTALTGRVGLAVSLDDLVPLLVFSLALAAGELLAMSVIRYMTIGDSASLL